MSKDIKTATTYDCWTQSLEEHSQAIEYYNFLIHIIHFKIN